jgi:hypothetical protein
LKKKNEEAFKSQQKLRNVMALLKRSSTPSKVAKTSNAFPHSPAKKLSRSSKTSNLPRARKLELVRDESPSYEITKVNAQAQLKYDLLQKELANCIVTRHSRNVVRDLLVQNKRLMGEQQELLAERSRIITAEFEETGVYDPDKPQYMDERLGVLECELASNDSRIRVIQEQLLRTGAITDLNLFEKSLTDYSDAFFEVEDVDRTWENCVNLLQSFNRKELDLVSTMILEDLLNAKLDIQDKSESLDDKEKRLSELQVLIDEVRAAKVIEEFGEVGKDEPLEDYQAALKPSHSTDETVVEEPMSPRPHYEDQHCLESKSSPGAIHKSPSSGSIFKSHGLANADVFERLATAHTLASQAKVIPKLTNFVDKDLPDI